MFSEGTLSFMAKYIAHSDTKQAGAKEDLWDKIFALILSNFNIASSALSVSGFVDNTKNSLYNFALPRQKFKRLAGPPSFGVFQLLDKHYYKIGFFSIII
jgi:hypothetical protein